jgi:hypothetical protein
VVEGRRDRRGIPGAYRVVANKYYVDEIYGATVIGARWSSANAMAWFDTYM